MRILAFGLLPVLLVTGIAAAQPRDAQQVAALVLARQEAQEAARRSAALERQAAQATSEAARARAQAEAIAARIQGAEASITAAEADVRIVEGRRAEQRARLARQQAPIVELTAALQIMARRPPALALIRPGSMDDVVHVRSLLATALPVIQARTASIRGEIARGEALRRQAATAVSSLVQRQDDLKRERLALAQAEARQRRRSTSLFETALTESDRALAFGERAREIGVELGDRQVQARIRRLLDTLPGPAIRPDAAGAPDRGEEPRLAGYRLPLQGRLLVGTGELSAAGVHARGLVFEADPGTAVVAPAAGRVVYAGRFRGYREIVVIDHSGGWTSLVTRLAERAVKTGDQVAAGGLLGRSGAELSQVSVELRLNGRPVAIADQLH